MSAVSIPCPATLLPTKADLVNIFTQLADIPSQIQVEIAKLEEKAAFQPNLEETIRKQLENQANELSSVADSVRSILNGIKSTLGNFPISVTDPIYPGLSIPDLEWEKRMSALTQEFHLYIQAKMMEIIAAVLPISFSIPVLGLSIDLVQLFSNPGYRAQLKAQIQENVDQFFSFVPDLYKTYDKIYGLFSKPIKAEITWSYIMKELAKGGLSILYNAFGGLINKFKTIWNALGLPALPGLMNLNVEGIIQGVIGSLKSKMASASEDLKNLQAKLENAAEDLEEDVKESIRKEIEDATNLLNDIRQSISDALDSISIAGFSILSIVGGEIDSFVTNLEQKIERKLEAIRDFGEHYPEYLIKMWMNKVTAFFNAIGLGALVSWITFNFCQFLTLIGLPKSIDVGYGDPIQITPAAVIDPPG